MKRLNIHWFRSDLRLHDNPALRRTVHLSSSSQQDGGILPVFIFDTSRVYGSRIKSKVSGCTKCGPRRARFVIEAAEDLRRNLRKLGSDLLVAIGGPEDVLAEIAKRTIDHAAASEERIGGVSITIVCQEEICSEELAVDAAVKSQVDALIKQSAMSECTSTFETVWGSTLYDPSTLPFDGGVHGMPDTFTPFRKQVESSSKIGVPLDSPSSAELKLPQDIRNLLKVTDRCSFDFMPTLADLGYTDEEIESASAADPRCSLPEGHRGGETCALHRVEEYIWDKDLLRTYFDTRNGLVGPDYSTKLSPWLACGCVSPRRVAGECRRYEEERGVANKSTYWLVFELLVRDYFRFFARKHGDKIFHRNGTVGALDNNGKRKWSTDPKLIQAWKEGRTGYPLVDASMIELKTTGFLSNRSRQNVCSFLAIDLSIDWRVGAEYFEEVLIDYDVHSNYVNWANGAGVTGGRLNRFNIVKQGRDYDMNGEYVRLWCPVLRNVPDEYIHAPWEMGEDVQKECGVTIGTDYPAPVIDPTVQPAIMNSSGRSKKRGEVKQANQSRAATRGNINSNRGKGQRKDMKSLKTGSYQFDP